MNNDKKNALEIQVGGDHYKKGNMQPIELIEGVRMYGSCSSILRYIYRHKDKNGLQDLQKILHYCDFVAEFGNWYSGAYPKEGGCALIADKLCRYTELLFYKFIKTNPQLDNNQIMVILAIQNKDLDAIREYTKKEIEEFYTK